MRVGRSIALLILCTTASAGCAAGGGRAKSATPAAHGTVPKGAVAAGTYRVRPKDTVYGIAFRHHLDYRELARWNRLGPDYALAVGHTLWLHPPDNRDAPTQRALTNAPAKPAALPSGITWNWPTQAITAPRPVPGGGILLFGKVGQDVRAASSGRAVYVGNGIRGYGNLIILKHGDSVLSAYAHNQTMLIREGEEVTPGQVIGHMGTGPRQVAALYFEIRLNGKPVDPIKCLPKN